MLWNKTTMGNFRGTENNNTNNIYNNYNNKIITILLSFFPFQKNLLANGTKPPPVYRKVYLETQHELHLCQSPSSFPTFPLNNLLANPKRFFNLCFFSPSKPRCYIHSSTETASYSFIHHSSSKMQQPLLLLHLRSDGIIHQSRRHHVMAASSHPSSNETASWSFIHSSFIIQDATTNTDFFTSRH